MGNFRTDEDYPRDYDNPEMGDYSWEYGRVKKKNIISRIFNALGNTGKGIQNGLTIGKVLLILYFIAMVVIVINIDTVLDFLFYATMPILQDVILVLVLILLVYLGYIFLRYVLDIK